MKLNLGLYFIQTAKQEEEGLWIGLFFVIALIVLAIWAQLQPDEEENASYTPAGFDKSPHEKEKRLKSYLDTPWLMWEGLIIEVKKTNPSLASIANQKFKEYNDKKSNDASFEKISEITDDQGNISLHVSTDEDSLQRTKESLKKIYEAEGYEIKIEVTHEKKKRSRKISQDVKDKVWNRDGGKCVECGSNENLEFDHIIPHSKGGANTYRNIQLLCENCNRSKSNKIG